jgi:hypothetical protein
MENQKKNYSFIFVAVYYIFVAAAFGFAYFMLTYRTANSEFVGVYPIVVTLPWSLLLAPALIFIKSATLKLVILFLCAIPTAIFLNKLGRQFENT